MIKTTGEIVNAALNLSQIEASNMLSFSSITYLINSVYGRLYDYITQHSEDFGTIGSPQGLVGKVPHNMLKVRGVYKFDGIHNLDELERVDRKPEHGQYWLHGDTLICGGNESDQFILWYYPKAVTLTFACKPEPTNCVKLYENYLAEIKGSDISVINLDTAEELFYPYTGTIKELVLFKGRPVYLTDTNILYKDDGAIQNVLSLHQDKWGGYAYGYIHETEGKFKVGWDGAVEHFEGAFSHTLWGAQYYLENNVMLCAHRDEPDIWHDVTENFVSAGRVITNAVFSDPYIAVETGGWDGKDRQVRVTDGSYNWYTVRPLLRSCNLSDVSLIDFDHNDENGYGIICETTGQRLIMGFLPDTLLDYPRTIYFDWIEAELAKLFLIEARQEITTIDALASQYWTRLLEGAEREVSNSYRLKHRRGSRW